MRLLRATSVVAIRDDLFVTLRPSPIGALARVSAATGSVELLLSSEDLLPIAMGADDAYVYVSTFRTPGVQRVPRSGGSLTPWLQTETS